MKLWQKDEEKLNQIVEAFETEADLLVDQKLIKYDCLASIAHAKQLHKIGILSAKELNKLEAGLNEILKLDQKGRFKLNLGDEDLHSKIENFLTEKYGEAGKKIHTARSRNDQVLTALRLYSKDQLSLIEKELLKVQQSLKKFAKEYGGIKMPGYTHMQKAMPSSINLWINSFTESLVDNLMQLDSVYKLIDQSPLGSAAGYGLPIKIDRIYTAKDLGFSKVQKNPIYCQNSRLKFEAYILAFLIFILMDVNKLASDIMLFTTSEFNLFTVSDSITTGSSIMPQKKNLDLAELLRSKVHLILGNYVQIVSLSSNLPSGYNRDFQDSKKPLMESFEIILACLQITGILIRNIAPNKGVLEKATSDDIYATEKALNLVLEGKPFREAYKKVAKNLKGGA